MLKARTLGSVIALGALAALPACSMFGGGGSSGSSGSQYRQSSNSGSAYNTASNQQAPEPGATVTGQAAITPDMIRNVQTRLKQDNDYRGSVDGVWGPMTERGVRQWQQSHNVSASGQLDMATLQAMNITTDNSQNNAAAQPNYSTAGRPTSNSYTSDSTRQPTTDNNTAPNTTNNPNNR